MGLGKRKKCELVTAIADQQAVIVELVGVLGLVGDTINELRGEVRELKELARRRQTIKLRLAGGAGVETQA